MRWGLVLGLAVALGAGCGPSGSLHGDAASAAGGSSGGAAGKSGTGGAAGQSGAGGGGTGSGGARATDAGADAIQCGTNFCTGTTYCCNPTCGVCSPRGELCAAQICGSDASSSFDAFGCVAIPKLDDDNCGGRRPPHFYSCVLSELSAPCVVRNIGDVTNTFCCP